MDEKCTQTYHTMGASNDRTSEQCGLTEDRVPLQSSKKAIRDKAMLVFSPGGGASTGLPGFRSCQGFDLDSKLMSMSLASGFS